MERGAVFSACGQYRYSLTRRWAQGPLAVVIGLNPSTADATVDDQTIRGLMVKAERWGYGGLLMMNLFAYRSTDSKKLLHTVDPVGPENDEHLTIAAWGRREMIAAWGNASPLIPARAQDVLRILGKMGITIKALRIGKSGQPWHPLYLPHSIEPFVWKRGWA